MKTILSLLAKSPLLIAGALYVLPAHSIVDFSRIQDPAKLMVVKGFETKLPEYLEYYQKSDNQKVSTEHFWFEISAGVDRDGVIPVYKMEGSAEEALAELIAARQLRYPGDRLRVLEEFALLQESIQSRGFEKSTNRVVPLRTVVIYKEQLSSDQPGRFLHQLTFEQEHNFQPKGQRLQPRMQYPSVILRGQIFIRCQAIHSQCELSNLSIDEAVIKWESISGSKGGMSSSGG